jgi:hypothetical protein
MKVTEAEVAHLMAHPWSYAGLAPRRRIDLRLLFWSNFSLGVWSCWSFFQADKHFYVRRIEWARGSDRMRVPGEAPTTFGAETPISLSHANGHITDAERLLADCRNQADTGIRLDGVTRHLHLPGRPANPTFSWFAGSKNSVALDAWLEEASVSVDNLLSGSTARGGANAA